jgi:hypothetical protein
MKTKPFYILIKYVATHPHNKGKSNLYKIWKDYDDTCAYDSPIYDVLDYFDSLREARHHVKTLSNKT